MGFLRIQVQIWKQIWIRPVEMLLIYVSDQLLTESKLFRNKVIADDKKCNYK